MRHTRASILEQQLDAGCAAPQVWSNYRFHSVRPIDRFTGIPVCFGAAAHLNKPMPRLELIPRDTVGNQCAPGVLSNV